MNNINDVKTHEDIAEMSIQALAIWDTETRFHAMSKQGDISQALAILNRLNSEEKTKDFFAKSLKT